MQTTFTTESIKAAFTYPFRDPDWVKKLLTGSAITLTGFLFPPIMILVYGYTAQIIRHIIAGGDTPALPRWEGWQSWLKDGLKLFGVTLLYTAPATVIILISAFLPIPFVITQILDTEGMPFFTLLTLLSVIAQMLGFATGAMLSIVEGLLVMPAQGHVVATGRFAAAFEVKGWWPVLKAAAGDFGIAYLIMMCMSLLTGVVTQVLFITVFLAFLWPFLIAPLSTYMLVVTQTLCAQAYRAGVQKRASAQSAH